MGILSKMFGKDQTTDVLELLTAQHEEVDGLIAMLEKGEGDRSALFTELADKLSAHAIIEEKIFYPAIMAKDTSEMLHEAVEEHLSIKRLLSDLITMDLDKESFHGKMHVLKEQVAHHAHKEEEDKLFPKVKSLLDADERAALGNEMLVMFEELTAAHSHRDVPADTAEAAPLASSKRSSTVNAPSECLVARRSRDNRAMSSACCIRTPETACSAPWGPRPMARPSCDSGSPP
jgi:hemerythrin superfamily protein